MAATRSEGGEGEAIGWVRRVWGGAPDTRLRLPPARADPPSAVSSATCSYSDSRIPCLWLAAYSQVPTPPGSSSSDSCLSHRLTSRLSYLRGPPRPLLARCVAPPCPSFCLGSSLSLSQPTLNPYLDGCSRQNPLRGVSSRLRRLSQRRHGAAVSRGPTSADVESRNKMRRCAPATRAPCPILCRPPASADLVSMTDLGRSERSHRFAPSCSSQRTPSRRFPQKSAPFAGCRGPADF